jgi:transcriptional regulator with XRE-family HTH domain
MDDLRLGALIRAVRMRRGLRQRDVAAVARVSHAAVSLVERGHCQTLSLATLRRIGAAVDVRVDVVGRWRGGDADRLLSRPHSMLAEDVASAILVRPGWQVVPEVSFSIYGERGVIDQLAWHPATGTLLVIELKTQLVDVNEMLGTLDRKQRLARPIANDRAWNPARIAAWVILTDTSTNRRHARDHASLLRTRLPSDGRGLRALLRNPSLAPSGLAFWADSSPGSTRLGSRPTKPAGHGKATPRRLRPSVNPP